MGRPRKTRVDAAVEWATTLREIFQDAQIEAVDEAQYHTSKQKPSTTTSTENTATEKDLDQEIRERDERALRPALGRLQALYRAEVGEGDDVAEEQWVLFLEELWIAVGRVLVAPKLHGVVLGTIASLVGLFLRGNVAESTSQQPKKAKKKQADSDSEEDEDDEPSPVVNEDRSMSELRGEVLKRLMKATKTDDKTIRLRACQMLQLILNKLDSIDDDTTEKLRVAITPRASDKVASIRAQSVLILKHFQDGNNPKDEVIQNMMRLMVSDPSKEVRKLALENIAVTQVTFGDLVIRIRDISDDVRAAAFHVLRQHMKLKDIPINDRAQLLDQGLQDRSPGVRKACESMLLERWLADSKQSPAKLLQALDVEHFTEMCTKVSKLLIQFYTTSHPFDKMIPSVDVPYILSLKEGEVDFNADLRDALHGASVFFWREQCVYFHEAKDEEHLAILLPSISDYIKVVALAGSSLVASGTGPEANPQDEESMIFVMQQLLALGHSLDFHDEHGRRSLLESLRKLLGDPAVDNRVIRHIMELMATIYAIDNSQNDFVRVVAEILSDLYDRVDRPVKEADSDDDDEDVEVESSQSHANGPTEEELEEATRRFEFLEQHLTTLEYESEEYIMVQKEMEQLEAMLQDPKVLAYLRCLEILAQLLKLTNFNLKHPVVAGFARYILPAIESDVPAIRETGMECLGLFCLLDRKVAERHLIVFWRALTNEDEEREVKMNCIRSIMDIVFSFANLTPAEVVRPPKAVQRKTSHAEGDDDEAMDEHKEGDDEGGDDEEEEEQLKLETVFMGLAQLAAASHDDLDVQATIVEGFAKLFLMHRVRSPPVLSFLLETFFSPQLQKVQFMSEHGYQARALQLMSVFFPTFVKASTLNCSLFEEAAIHLVQKSVENYEASDAAREVLLQIDLVTACKYMFHLLSHADEPTTEATIKKQDPDASAPASSVANQQCAHHNRVAINMCVDLLAIEQLRSAPGTKFDALELDARQKLLAKVVSLTDISAAEPRSALLLLALLKRVVTECFTTQKAVGKTVEALHKRLAATYALGRRQLGKASTDGATVQEQDHEWATERVEMRATQLRVAIRECNRSRYRIRKSSANSVGGRRVSSASRRRTVDQDSDDDEEADEDEEEGAARASSGDEDEDEIEDGDEEEDEREAAKSKRATAAASGARRMSARQSLSLAVDRMRTKNREFDVAMQQAVELSEEEEDDDDDDQTGEDEDEIEDDEE